MKRTKALRHQLKKIYRKKKAQDSKEIGVKKNDLVQAIHLQNRLPAEKRDKEVLKRCLENLAAITKENRFCDDFPSFSKFYKYVTAHKNGFTKDDIKEL